MLFPTLAELPPGLKALLPLDQEDILIDGQLRPWTGPRRELQSPVWIREGERLSPLRLGSVPDMGPADALEALDAAERAFGRGRGSWPSLGVEGRIRRMEDFAQRMAAQRGPVVELLMAEIAKPRAEAALEFDRTLDYLGDTLRALKAQDRADSRLRQEQGMLAQIRDVPLGVALVMGPFNYPLNESLATLLPALLMGNTAVLKLPKHGSLLFGPLLRAFGEAFPPGVVNTLHGAGRHLAGPLMETGRLDILAFIGTSKVATQLKRLHPHPHRLRAVLGLDAKNPAIVLPDADLEPCVAEILKGALSFNGQRCTAIKMVFVHQDLQASFLGALTRGVEALKPGLPWEAEVGITALAEPHKPSKLRELMRDALDRGARVLNAGGGLGEGAYLFPAILHPVDASMRIWREEQFGPLVPVAAYRDPEEVIRYVTESAYGQQVSLFGRDAGALAALLDPLVSQVCRVNLNSQCQRGPDALPFTGRKDSGEGSLSVEEALRAFSIRTLVAARETPENRRIVGEILRGRLSRFLSTDFIL